MIQFKVPLLPPSVNSVWRKRAGGSFYLTKEAEAYIRAVGLIGPKSTVIANFYAIEIIFSIQEKDFLRGDLDNRLKISIDSLAKSGIIRDDRYITQITTSKVKVKERADEATEFRVMAV